MRARRGQELHCLAIRRTRRANLASLRKARTLRIARGRVSVRSVAKNCIASQFAGHVCAAPAKAAGTAADNSLALCLRVAQDIRAIIG